MLCQGPSTTPKCNHLFLGRVPENVIEISRTDKERKAFFPTLSNIGLGKKTNSGSVLISIIDHIHFVLMSFILSIILKVYIN